MSAPILLNQNNLVSNQSNNVYQYVFPSGSVTFKDSKIAINQIIIPYSFYNITPNFNNQTFSIILPDGSSTVTLNLTIPTGFYTLQQINSYIQSILIANGYYLINSANQNVYYIELVGNTNLDYVQLNCYQVPTTLPSGWSYGTGLSKWGSTSLPTNVNQVPQLVTNTSNFGLIIGFANSTTFPATATQTQTYSITSTFTPQISPISSILFSCDLCSNLLSNPTNLMTTIPITTTYASQIIFQPRYPLYLKCLDGSRNSFKCSFLDQNMNPLNIIDTNIIIILDIIKD